MVKYDRLKEPLRKAKESAMLTENIDRSAEKKLKEAYEGKRRYDARDEELFQFGFDLYNSGYALDDFIGSINACLENNFETEKEIEASGWFIYDNVEHVPSYEKIAKVVNEPNFIEAVKNGYNVAYRKALIKQIEEKRGISR